MGIPVSKLNSHIKDIIRNVNEMCLSSSILVSFLIMSLIKHMGVVVGFPALSLWVGVQSQSISQLVWPSASHFMSHCWHSAAWLGEQRRGAVTLPEGSLQDTEPLESFVREGQCVPVLKFLSSIGNPDWGLGVGVGGRTWCLKYGSLEPGMPSHECATCWLRNCHNNNRYYWIYTQKSHISP